MNVVIPALDRTVVVDSKAVSIRPYLIDNDKGEITSYCFRCSPSVQVLSAATGIAVGSVSGEGDIIIQLHPRTAKEWPTDSENCNLSNQCFIAHGFRLKIFDGRWCPRHFCGNELEKICKLCEAALKDLLVAEPEYLDRVVEEYTTFELDSLRSETVCLEAQKANIERGIWQNKQRIEKLLARQKKEEK